MLSAALSSAKSEPGSEQREQLAAEGLIGRSRGGCRPAGVNANYTHQLRPGSQVVFDRIEGSIGRRLAHANENTNHYAFHGRPETIAAGFGGACSAEVTKDERDSGGSGPAGEYSASAARSTGSTSASHQRAGCRRSAPRRHAAARDPVAHPVHRLPQPQRHAAAFGARRKTRACRCWRAAGRRAAWSRPSSALPDPASQAKCASCPLRPQEDD